MGGFGDGVPSLLNDGLPAEVASCLLVLVLGLAHANAKSWPNSLLDTSGFASWFLGKERWKKWPKSNMVDCPCSQRLVALLLLFVFS
jgi:hypothetical protein